MSNLLKRTLSLVIALVMVLGLLPVTSLAAEGDYTKATSILAGDTVVFVCETATVELSSFNGTSYAYGTAYTTSPAGTMPFEVVTGAAAGTYAFKNGDNYIAWSSGNSLKQVTTLNNNSSWSVSFDDNGNAIIINAADTTRKLQWNKNSPRFAAYTSTQTAIQLYKAAEVESDCDHSTTTIANAAEATCTTNGYTGDTVCANADCGKTIAAGTVIPALGHSYVDGICSRCGDEAVIYYQVTATSDLKAGVQVIIAAADFDVAMSTTQNGNNRGQIDVVKADNIVYLNDSVQVMTLEKDEDTGLWAFNTGSGYLYAASSTSNYLRTQETNNANGLWEITVEDGVASVVAINSTNRNVMQYNDYSSIFSCYSSASQDAMVLYVSELNTCEHVWSEATCTEAATCTLCGATGELAAHAYVTTEAEGYTVDVCSVCGDMANVVAEADATLPLDIAAILGAAQSDYTTDKYYVTGTITEVYNTSYGNMYITDGTNTLTIYGTYNADGTIGYASMESKPVADDTVVLYGVLGNYYGAVQMKNAWIIDFTNPVVNVAAVNGVEYVTLAEAVAAAEDGDTVTLLCDAEGAGVVIDKSITIDLGGYTYTFNSAVGSTGTETLGFQILKDNDVVIMNGKLSSTDVIDGGKEVKVLIQNYANLTLTDVYLDGTSDYIQYALSNNSGEILLEGETYIYALNGAVAFDVYDYSSAGYTVPSVTVNTTGVIYGKIEVSPAASLVINSGVYGMDVTEWCAEDLYAYDENGDGLYTVAVCEHSYFYACDSVCQICNRVTNPDATHTVEHVAAVAATCTENGNLEYWYCTICGSAWTDEDCTQVTNLMSVTIPASCSYNAVYTAAKDATCTENGNAEYWYCANCDVYYADEACTIVTNAKNLVIPASCSYNAVYTAAKDATCTENGNAEYWYCANCDVYYADEACTIVTNAKNLVIPASCSYNAVYTAAKEATCTENGNAEYWYCANCDVYYADEACTIVTNAKNLVIPATGHTYFYACDPVCMNCYELTNPDAAHSIIHVDAVAATCTENGNIEYWTCEHCGTCWDNAECTGMPLNRMMVIVPAAHTYDYACSEYCSVCWAPNADAAAHTYTNNCDDTCDVCGEGYRNPPHNPGEHVPAVVPANCLETGMPEYWICADCNVALMYNEYAGGYVGFEPAWYSYSGDHNYVCGVCEFCGLANETITVYFENNWLWTEVYTYYWFEGGDVAAWPGVEMELCGSVNGNELYVLELPVDAIGLIFSGIKNDGSGDRDQTPDITGGWYDGIIYSMLWSDGNAVQTTDMSAYVAKDSEGNLYTSLADALEVGGEITLLADITTDTAFVIDNTVVLDTGYYSISTTENDTVGDGVFHVVSGGDLTLNGYGTINGVGGNDYCMAIWADGGKVTINSGNFTNLGAGEDDHYDLIYVKNGGEVVIYGGYFEAQTPAWTLNSHDTLTGTITVYGGEFVGFNPADCATEGAGTNWVAQCHVSEKLYEWFDVWYVSSAHTYDNACDVDCNVCGETREVEHTVVEVEAKAATCTEEGNIAYWYCEVCGQAWLDAECTRNTNLKAVVLPVTHNLVHVEAVEAACHFTGNMEHWYCTECDTVWADEALTQITNHKNVVIPALGGEVVHVEAKAATCTETGNIEYWYCETCEQVWQDEALTQLTNHKNVILPMAEHEYFYACDTHCMNCGELTNPDAAHTITYVAAKAGTDCATWDGNVEYWTCSDCGAVWLDEALRIQTSRFGTVTNGDHIYENGTCTVCGEADPNALFDIDGANMTLGNSLAMNFYILPSDLVEGETYYAVITKEYADGRDAVTVTVEQEDWTWHQGYQEWYVSFNGVAAKEMTDTITVVIYNSNDEAVSNVWVDSVQAYTMRVLLKEEAKASPNAEKLTLYVDMLNYGAAAQVEFGYNTDNLANNQLTEAQAAYATSDDIELTDNRVKGEGYSATSLTLESDITMNFFFLASAIPTEHDDYYAIATWTDHYGNAKEVRVEGEDFAQLTNDTDWYVAVKGVVVADARQLVTVTVYNAAGEAVATGADSIESYVARNMSKKPIYLAIMKFCVSAYESFH